MAVMGLLMPVAGMIKVRYRGAKADIDSPCGKLHYRATATVCFMATLLVTANDFWGKTIDCMSAGIPGNVLNTYCWILSTFSVPYKPGVKGEDFAYPGLAQPQQGDEKIYHAYYQWVPFVLLLQGMLFYFPHWLWKTLEDRKLDKITNGLRGRTLSVDERKDQCEVLVKYVRETFHMHNFYAFKYFLCDILNFVNVIGQLFLLNAFFGGVFMAYGTDVLRWSEVDAETRTDPMVKVFPRLTKCTFHKYGHSGTLEKHDALCVLALNIINEKIFVFLWFWLIFLAVVTILYLIYVGAMISIPSLRRVMVERNAKHDVKEKMDVLMKRAQMGDWFLIYLLSKNLDSLMFKEFIMQLTGELKKDA